MSVLARTAKFVFLDQPISELTVITAHEVGGHGARARDVGLSATYLFYLPGVYRFIFAPDDPESAGAFTHYLTERPVEGDRDAIGRVGGLEANYVHAWWINARIVRGGGWVHHGDLITYLGSKLTYAPSFLRLGTQRGGGDDISNYVADLQELSNGWRNADRARIESRLMAGYAWNLVDPTMIHAFYGALVAGIGQGRPYTRMPLPTVFGQTFLLSPRYALSPFGAEHALDLFLARNGRLLDIYGRVGSSGLASYWGAGARVLGLRVGDRLTLGGELDVWRQPEILLDERGVFERPYRVGVNVGISGDVRLSRMVSLTAKVAGKTPGWVMGQPIGGGPHGYAGLSVAW